MRVWKLEIAKVVEDFLIICRARHCVLPVLQDWKISFSR